MKRSTIVVPGFDCIAEACMHDPPQARPGSHGRCGDKWIYVVADDDGMAATTLDVSTKFLRGKAVDSAAWKVPNYPRGSYIQLHVAWPTSQEELCDPENTCETNMCQHLGDRPCFCAYGSAFKAEEFYASFRAGGTDPVQTEAFWLALEAEHRRLRETAEAGRPDKMFARCGACGGKGLVPA